MVFSSPRSKIVFYFSKIRARKNIHAPTSRCQWQKIETKRQSYIYGLTLSALFRYFFVTTFHFHGEVNFWRYYLFPISFTSVFDGALCTLYIFLQHQIYRFWCFFLIDNIDRSTKCYNPIGIFKGIVNRNKT